MLILILESSTTSAKAMLFDPAMGALETINQPYAFAAPREVGVQDADAVFAQTAAAGRKICQGKKIDLIVLSSTWHNILVTDANMKPLTPAFTWSYNGAAAIANMLRADESFCRMFYQRTGCMVHAIYPFFKLMMLQNNGLNLSDKRLCCQGSYNFYQLTGQTLMSDCSASGSGLMNIHTRQWDQDLLGMLGLQSGQLFSLGTYHQPGALNAAGAKLLGLAQGVPVIPSYPDGALNQVGAGALAPDKMTFSVGTSGALRIACAHPVLPAKPSTWCYLSPDAWLLGAATSGACNCIDWYKNLYGSNLLYKDLEAGVDIGGAPLFFPFLFGERCPGWHDAWAGGFLDVRPHHTKSDLYHAVQEGVLFNLYQCYQLLCQLNGVPREIHLSGGIMHSRRWMQMAADIFGQPLLCADIPDVSMIGAAVLGMRLLQRLPNIQDYRHQATETLRPDPAMHEKYQKRFTEYLERYEKNIF